MKYIVKCWYTDMHEEKLVWERSFSNKIEADNYAKEKDEEYSNQYTDEDYENGFENPYSVIVREA